MFVLSAAVRVLVIDDPNGQGLSITSRRPTTLTRGIFDYYFMDRLMPVVQTRHAIGCSGR